MIHSRDRILTTHVGSLPRNDVLSDLLVKREAGEAYDKAVFDAEMDKAVRHVVEQAEGGRHRRRQRRRAAARRLPDLRAGAHGGLRRRLQAPARSRVRGVPRAHELPEAPLPHVSKQQNAPECQGELKYLDIAPLQREIARFKRVVAGEPARSPRCFMTAPSPGIISSTMINATTPRTRPTSRRSRAR